MARHGTELARHETELAGARTNKALMLIGDLCVWTRDFLFDDFAFARQVHQIVMHRHIDFADHLQGDGLADHALQRLLALFRGGAAMQLGHLRGGHIDRRRLIQAKQVRPRLCN